MNPTGLSLAVESNAKPEIKGFDFGPTLFRAYISLVLLGKGESAVKSKTGKSLVLDILP